MAENILGPYGAWATGLAGFAPGRLSFLRVEFRNEGMKEADSVLVAVYQQAGAADSYDGRFYPGGHKYDLAMQEDAFEF